MFEIYFDCDEKILIEENKSLETMESSVKWCIDNNFPHDFILPENLEGISYRDGVVYQEVYSDLSTKYSSEFSKLVAYAIWLVWYSCQRRSKLYQYVIKENLYKDDSWGEIITSAEGVGEILGYTKTTLDEIHGHTFGVRKIQELFSFKETPTDIDVLRAIYLWFMYEASKKDKDQFSMNICLYEAKAAQAYAFGLEMWDEAQKNIDTQNPDLLLQARREIARRGSDKRHTPNREMKKEVIERYRQEKTNFSSKDEAAFSLVKDFPFEFSTIRNWLKGA